jgi:hypothetical protein
MKSNLARYQRIALFYDLLDLPFERKRYSGLRPLMFQNLGGQLLDAGIGTGRNCVYYPPDAVVPGSIPARRCSNGRIAAARSSRRVVGSTRWM